MTIHVKLDNGAYLPTRAHALDAGYDLRTPVDFSIPPADEDGAGIAVIDTGVHMAIPEGYFGELKSKSGLNVRGSLFGTGLIDAGYTGSIQVKLYNLGPYWHHFRRGDKIIQIVIQPFVAPELVEVESLPETERGENGFGSTGR